MHLSECRYCGFRGGIVPAALPGICKTLAACVSSPHSLLSPGILLSQQRLSVECQVYISLAPWLSVDAAMHGEQKTGLVSILDKRVHPEYGGLCTQCGAACH